MKTRTDQVLARLAALEGSGGLHALVSTTQPPEWIADVAKVPNERREEFNNRVGLTVTTVWIAHQIGTTDPADPSSKRKSFEKELYTRLSAIENTAAQLLEQLAALDDFARRSGFSGHLPKHSSRYRAEVAEIAKAARAIRGFFKRGRGAPQKADARNRPLIEEFLGLFLLSVRLSGGNMGTRREAKLVKVVEALEKSLPPKITHGMSSGMMRRALKAERKSAQSA